MAQLVDSSVLIALERRRQSLDTLKAITSNDSLGIATITASELLVGLFRANTQARRLRRQLFMNEVFSMIPVLPFDLTVAHAHAELWAQLAATGQMIDTHDMIIAATALTHDYAVLTDNLRHFERVPGLVVRQPQWPK